MNISFVSFLLQALFQRIFLLCFYLACLLSSHLSLPDKFTLCLITFLLGVTVFDSFDTFLILTMVILFYIATSVHLRNSWNYSYPCSYVVDILFIGKNNYLIPSV